MATCTKTSPILSRALLAAGLIIVMAACSCTESRTDYYMYDAAVMRANREAIRAGAHIPAYERLIHDADSLLDMTPLSVMDKDAVPPSGDKHDYMSQGPYWWPDPEKPDGLPYIRRDGETNPEIRNITDARYLGLTCKAVDKLALAYYFSGREQYAAKAAELLRVWFLDEATYMHPNLDYAQRVPGVCEGRGIGIIDTREITKTLQSVQLLEESRAWTKSDDKALKAWVRDYRDWLLTSPNGLNENTQPNNHGTSYDLQVSVFSLFAGDPAPAVRHMQDTTWFRYDQIRQDGCQSREMARSKSWSYCCMNINLLTRLAMADELLGADFWHYVNANGVTLEQAYEYFFEFLRDEREWPGENIHGGFSMGRLLESMAMAAPHYDTEYFHAMMRKAVAFSEKSFPADAEWTLVYQIPSFD